LRVPSSAAVEGGQNLAHPVGPEFEERDVRDLRHTFAPPACQIGHHDLAHDVKRRFVEDDPSARAAAASLEWGAELLAQRRCGDGVRRSRARARDQLAVDDLGHQVFRDLEQIVVRGGPFCGTPDMMLEYPMTSCFPRFFAGRLAPTATVEQGFGHRLSKSPRCCV